MKKQSKQPEYYTWADKVATILKQRKAKKHVVHGMWTPSGFFHIGNARPELFTPAIAYKAMKDARMKAEFNLFFDDFDDFDSFPAGVKVDKKKFQKYLGLPIREVPSPDNKHKNWADYFEAQIKEVAEKFGIKPNFLSSYDQYKKGKYDCAIKLVLKNASQVKQIWKEIVGKEPEGLPVMVRCQKCKKALTTLATKYDGNQIHYQCTKEQKGIKPCGYKGKLKPGKGNTKLPWRLHWPATWFIFGTTFESGGKDHFTPQGSVDTGKAFAGKIFQIEPPLLIGTEFVTIDNKKISGSQGNVISMADWLEFAEPELLRFMYTASPPKKAINFDLTTNKFFLLTSRFDRAERIYFGKLNNKDKNEDKKKIEQLKRQYKVAQIKLPKSLPKQFPYTYAVLIAQTRNTENEKEVMSALEALGYKKLDKENKKRIFTRIKLAKTWLDKYAPEDAKIKIISKPKAKATKEEKAAIKEIIKLLSKKANGEKLQEQVYDIIKAHNLNSSKFFALLYRILLNKDKGPRLGPFIVAIGTDKVKRLLAQV